MRLSYTALETYQTCPLKFKFREIDRIKTPQTKEAFFGSLIHDVLKMLHSPSRLVPPTEEEMLAYFSQKWNPEIFEDKQEESIAFSIGVKILKDYYSKNYPAQFNVVDLETRFEVPISERREETRFGERSEPALISERREETRFGERSEPALILDNNEMHTITGIIDRIDKLEDGTFEVIDYKTAKRMPSQKIIDNNLQLAVYHLGVANRWPSILEQKRPVKLSLYYLQHGEKLSTTRAPESLNETKEKILLTIDKIKDSISAQKFEAQPGPLCDWCQFQRWCPLFKHKFKEPTRTDQEIKLAIDEFLELKAKTDENSKRMAELRDTINSYYNAEDVERVFSDKGYITRSTKKTFVYDGKALKEILEPLGKWKEVLVVDTAKLKGVIASLPVEIKRKIEKAKKVGKETQTITITRNKK